MAGDVPVREGEHGREREREREGEAEGERVWGARGKRGLERPDSVPTQLLGLFLGQLGHCCDIITYE